VENYTDCRYQIFRQRMSTLGAENTQLKSAPASLPRRGNAMPSKLSCCSRGCRVYLCATHRKSSNGCENRKEPWSKLCSKKSRKSPVQVFVFNPSDLEEACHQEPNIFDLPSFQTTLTEERDKLVAERDTWNGKCLASLPARPPQSLHQRQHLFVCSFRFGAVSYAANPVQLRQGVAVPRVCHVNLLGIRSATAPDAGRGAGRHGCGGCYHGCCIEETSRGWRIIDGELTSLIPSLVIILLVILPAKLTAHNFQAHEACHAHGHHQLPVRRLLRIAVLLMLLTMVVTLVGSRSSWSGII
jgi:hypothetical protein